MTNTTYDNFKIAGTIILPAFSALYVGLAQLWGLPYGEQIAGTFALIATFCGSVLKIKSDQYNMSKED